MIQEPAGSALSGLPARQSRERHAHTRLPPACSPSLLQEGTPDTARGTLITAPPPPGWESLGHPVA